MPTPASAEIKMLSVTSEVWRRRGSYRQRASDEGAAGPLSRARDALGRRGRLQRVHHYAKWLLDTDWCRL